MALDGFSLGNIQMHRDISPAQMLSQAEQQAIKEAEVKIQTVTDSSKQTGIGEKQGDSSAGGGRFTKSQNEDENEDEESQSGLSEKDFENRDPKEFTVRINPKTEMVELYNNKNKKVVETISAEDLMSLISKMDSASGVLVNKKI